MQFSLSTSIFALLAATNIAAGPINTRPHTQTVNTRSPAGNLVLRAAGTACIPFEGSRKKGVCNAKGQCTDPNDASGAGPFDNGAIYQECLA